MPISQEEVSERARSLLAAATPENISVHVLDGSDSIDEIIDPMTGEV